MALGRAASDWCQKKKNKYNAQSIYIPAGRTPTALYENWKFERPEFLNGVKLIQIDDVLTGRRSGMFKRFFIEHLSDFEKQIEFITTGQSQADLAILGLGLNGHVAFHEPGIDDSFYSGCMALSEITCHHLDLEPDTKGISYGVGAFIQSKAILIMVSGSSKCEILARLVDRDPRLPATSLLKHHDVTILADPDALRRIDVRSGGRKREYEGFA